MPLQTIPSLHTVTMGIMWHRQSSPGCDDWDSCGWRDVAPLNPVVQVCHCQRQPTQCDEDTLQDPVGICAPLRMRAQASPMPKQNITVIPQKVVIICNYCKLEPRTSPFTMCQLQRLVSPSRSESSWWCCMVLYVFCSRWVRVRNVIGTDGISIGAGLKCHYIFTFINIYCDWRQWEHKGRDPAAQRSGLFPKTATAVQNWKLPVAFKAMEVGYGGQPPKEQMMERHPVPKINGRPRP